MGKKKKFYTYFYVKYLPFPFLLFMNNHFLRARLRRMLWENFHLIKSVVLAKNLDVTKVTNNYRCTNRCMNGQMDDFLYKSSNSTVAKFYVFNIFFKSKF